MHSSDDHRSRVGAQRRERTRARLLETAVRAVAARGSADVPIDELLALADVSRGTFYKYFPDARALLVAASQAASDELIAHLHALASGQKDPAARVAVGMRGVLAMLEACPPLASLIARSGWPYAEVDPAHGIFHRVGQNIDEGRAAGRFADLDGAFALDLVAALVIGAAARLAAGTAPPGFAAQVVATALRGLGLSADEAARLASATVTLPPLPDGTLLAALSRPG